MKLFMLLIFITGSSQVFGEKITILETEDIFLKNQLCNKRDEEKCFTPGEISKSLIRLLNKKGYQNVSCSQHSFFGAHYGMKCVYEKPIIEAGKCYLEDRDISVTERVLTSPVESVFLSLFTGGAVISEAVRLDLMTITQLLDENNEYFDKDRDPYELSKISVNMLKSTAKSIVTGKLKVPMSCDTRLARNYDPDREIDTSEINLKEKFGKIVNRSEYITGALKF